MRASTAGLRAPLRRAGLPAAVIAAAGRMLAACAGQTPRPTATAMPSSHAGTAPAAREAASPAVSATAGASTVPRMPEAEPGLYRCELDRKVTVRRLAPDKRSLVLNWQGQDHPMQAVAARTGALRYESPQHGLTWLVIDGKSMLLDSKRGRQLANECKL